MPIADSRCLNNSRLLFSVLLTFSLLCPTVSADSPGPSRQPWKRHAIDDSSQGADGVRLADFNLDGLIDIATGWEESGLIRVYLNPGFAASKQRWPLVTVGTVESPEDAFPFDWNRDGFLDVVSACEGENQRLYVHISPGSKELIPDAGSWETHPLRFKEQNQPWMYSTAMSTHGSGKSQTLLWSGAKGSHAQLGYFRSPFSDATARDLPWNPVAQVGWIMSLITVDLNADGVSELLYSDRRGERSGIHGLYLSSAFPDKLVWETRPIGCLDQEVMFIDCRDLNGDHRIDVAASVKPDQLVFLLQSKDRDEPWREIRFRTPDSFGTAKGVALGVLMPETLIDCVFSCEGADGSKSGVGCLSIRDWDDPQGFEWIPIADHEGVKFDRIELIDLDGDGDLDVLTCEERDLLGVIWYENPRTQSLPE